MRARRNRSGRAEVRCSAANPCGHRHWIGRSRRSDRIGCCSRSRRLFWSPAKIRLGNNSHFGQVSPGADGRHFGNEVPPLVRADLAGLQINGAGRAIEQPRVPIPVTRLRCVLTVCPGKPLDGGNRPESLRCLRIPSQEGWYRPTIEACGPLQWRMADDQSV